MGTVEEDVTKLGSFLPGMENWISVPAETHCGCVSEPAGHAGGQRVDSKALSQNGN